jgi:hypothetical protein
MRAKSRFIVILGLSILVVIAGWQSVVSLHRGQQHNESILGWECTARNGCATDRVKGEKADVQEAHACAVREGN